MGILLRKKGDVPALTGIAKLSIVVLIASLSASLADTIWALYLDSFVHSESTVGLISSGLTLLAFFSYFIFVPIIEKNSKSKIFAISLLLFAISYALFAIITKLSFLLIVACFITLVYSFRITSLGIMIRDKSKSGKLSRNEGLIYSVGNFAWVIGPLISGFIAASYGISYVFIISSILVLISLLLFLMSGIKDVNISKKVHNNVLSNFFEFFKDKQRTLSYIISGGVNMWWGFIYLFVPLHIIRNGLSDLWVGYFLFAVAVPLILTEYKFSRLPSRIGHRKVFKFGYFFVAVISFICFFMSNIFVVLGLLVVASFGMSLLEPTTETHFFKILKKKSDENRFYGPYNTTIDSSSFVGRISGSILLIFLPFNYLFILYGGFMLIMFFFSSKIKNIY